MGRRKTSMGEAELALARAEREALSEWKTVFKLSAIIAYARQTAEEVAPVFGVSAETVIRWAAAFRKSGVEGLLDRPKGHKPRRLGSAEAEALKRWVLSSRDAEGKLVHWTLKRLCREAARSFGVTIGHSAMAETLRRLGLSLKRPRPAHYKSNPAAAAEFKKKPRKRQRVS